MALTAADDEVAPVAHGDELPLACLVVVRFVVSVSAMLVSIHQKNIAQAFILERYFFVSIYPAVIPGTYLMVFLVVALLLCLLHQIYIQRS